MMRKVLYGIVVLFGALGCAEHDLLSGEKVPPSTVDYLIFGHTAGFCMECDALYKIDDGKLFGAKHQVIGDPDTVQLTELPVASYEIAAGLTFEVPSRFVNGSTVDTNRLGTYWPDAGHYYIEVRQSGKVYKWYIEAGAIPVDVAPFISHIETAIGKLN